MIVVVCVCLCFFLFVVWGLCVKCRVSDELVVEFFWEEGGGGRV